MVIIIIIYFYFYNYDDLLRHNLIDGLINENNEICIPHILREIYRLKKRLEVVKERFKGTEVTALFI